MFPLSLLLNGKRIRLGESRVRFDQPHAKEIEMPVTAHAVVSPGDGTFFDTDIELNDPQSGEVLIAIEACAICHTDIDILQRGYAHIVGHEGAGVAIATGPGVDHVKAGDPVLLNWAMPCGVCFQCRRGAENICQSRKRVPAERRTWKGSPVAASFHLGTMATHAIVSKEAVVRTNDTIAPSSACLLGCGVMTGFGSVVNTAKPEKDSLVVVIGAGGVGLSCIQGAKYCGAAAIVAIDVNPKRLALAKTLGATHTILASRDDAGLLQAAEDAKLLLGRAADYAFDCTAVPLLGAAPLAMIRNGGTAVAVSGIEQVVPIDMRLFEFDKLYITPLYGQCRPQRDFPLLLSLYERRVLKLDEMVSRTFPMSADGLRQALSDMREGNIAKAVLQPGA
jgi:S-(hydroxymethyl)glutathione dehydrogenase/alcohol dehydrogenase